MPDFGELVSGWGYLAIVVLVVLGNAGLPIPEDAILALAGYLASTGRLRLPLVLAVGFVSAVAGDNLGYWVGHRYGRAIVRRHHHWLGVSPRRLNVAHHFVTRYGPVGVFAARFVPGLRFTAGPLAGVAGLGFRPFVIANVLGAAIYVPLTVTAGYAIGSGLGAYVLVVLAVIGAIVLGSRQALRASRAGRERLAKVRLADLPDGPQ